MLLFFSNNHQINKQISKSQSFHSNLKKLQRIGIFCFKPLVVFIDSALA